MLATVKPGQARHRSARGHARWLRRALASKAGGLGRERFLGPKADYRIAMLAEHHDPALRCTKYRRRRRTTARTICGAAEAGAAQASYEDDSALYRAAGFDVALVRGRLEQPAHCDGQDELRLLHKLMGTGPKRKEKYTGLGW